ncbi:MULTISPECIES: YihY/virulence factor BrkB family protein [unclassified Siphonobacter]|uniref:YihY/virulence factor BrkB family protein n=1 Tax=unclassified Siphonobacter TaxID=2635712 RepID=UPI000CAE6F33|nr:MULTISPECIES: YihY/virulence factor BrkB family protein [unclassified Siphonobacter]MDQ1087600.1 membrane protein [Siphonobacter sp. SORGH_AS_1065]MDR6193751.1 membrane protein [Siphonobacter sp. SORGH_AS_0500]PKK37931.1 ribonuclease BN [Siphonobacter sp. SORGH_AS_0500]
MNRLKSIGNFFLEVYNEFSNDNALKMSASLSYYTIFSMAPMLLVIISLLGIFYGQEAIQGQVFGQIQGLVGKEAALQIQDLIKKAELSNRSPLALTVGIITLVIGATGVFGEMQDSINRIWSLRAKPKKGWLKLLINRLLSFSMIISMGFVLLVSLVLNSMIDVFSNQLERIFNNDLVVVFYVVNLLVIFAVITLLFALVFNVLPDGKLYWKDSFVGAGFTAILFMIGKFLIGLYLSKSNVGSTYGSAGSIVIVLLWVNYSAAILYFGAEFTKVYVRRFGRGIVPKSETVIVYEQEISPDQLEEGQLGHVNVNNLRGYYERR